MHSAVFFFQFKACLVFCAIIKIQSVIIKTKSGPVKGFEAQTEDISFYTFKNIPFAKQPVGDLRFELPQPTEPWTSEEELTSQKISCPQYPYYTGQQLHNTAFGQEDCLVLDVYMRKKDLLQFSSIPVLVYFHGGRFSHGSKEEYGAEFLLRFNDIIVVIPNYRLGILGFLSAQDSVLEGNYGLWDQRAALSWVSENIRSFGGDPERVTCAGHDAGGSSVGLHILSPQSKGYFKTAISGSGTALDPWLQNKDPVSALNRAANGLKCQYNSTNGLLHCLKRRSWRDLLKIQNRLKEVSFLPTINTEAENPFLMDHPEKLYSSSNWNIVNYMAGVTEDESSVEVAHAFDASLKHQHMDKIVMHFLQPYLHDVPNLEAVAVAAKYHYFRGSLIPTFASIEPQIVNLMSDFLYKSSLDRTLKLHSRRTSKTFMYVFHYESENQTLGHIFGPKHRHENYGVTHMEDVRYLFNTSFAPWTGMENNGQSKDMIKTMCGIWGNFIKTGFVMVRHYKKKSERGKYTIETMIEAVNKVKEEKSMKTVAAEFGLCDRILANYCRQTCPSAGRGVQACNRATQRG
ncbi:juvenile hormone esterase-like isoform X2 [Uloborus diversus]|uniref:juvenile hormone esterase-like isoform X2 n=1 Tax=Uloborus diversus TaxID=327109 RepID=UPI00240A2D96|nr:juvenile hormone esterase-like isoform X2 [Uloborus diversus]